MKKSFTLLMLVMLAFTLAYSTPSKDKSITDPSSTLEQIRSNLYAVQSDASTVLLDGDLTQYDPSYSNMVDGMDARKMSNFSENIGMIRGTTTLVIERRQTISLTDTIFYKTWQLQQRPYQLEFVTYNLNHPGLAGYLQDSYLNTSTPIDLNGTNHINFTVNADPASKDIYRFRLVFTTAASAGPLPLTFISQNAFQQNNAVNVDWKTSNETNVKQYTVEKSLNGIQFTNAKQVKATNLAVNNYSWIDPSPAVGNNYYRISSTEIDGAIKYSPIMKVFIGKEISSFRIFPNPVTGNNINLQLINQPAGLYEVRLANAFGQVIFTQGVQHLAGSSTETIHPGQIIPKGMYQLELVKPGGGKESIKLMF